MQGSATARPEDLRHPRLLRTELGGRSLFILDNLLRTGGTVKLENHVLQQPLTSAQTALAEAGISAPTMTRSGICMKDASSTTEVAD